MKKIIIAIVILLAVLIAVFYYNSTTNSGSSNDTITTVRQDTLSGVVELQGTIGDGTSMNELEIINSNGDTVYITVPGELVKGEINPGDCVDVVFYANEDENLATTVINVSSLCHVWSTKKDGLNQSLELDDKGVAITYNSNVDYCNWQLKNGCLILKKSRPIGSEKKEEADTFDIMKLTDSQLVIMNGQEETVYELEN